MKNNKQRQTNRTGSGKKLRRGMTQIRKAARRSPPRGQPPFVVRAIRERAADLLRLADWINAHRRMIRNLGDLS